MSQHHSRFCQLVNGKAVQHATRGLWQSSRKGLFFGLYKVLMRMERRSTIRPLLKGIPFLSPSLALGKRITPLFACLISQRVTFTLSLFLFCRYQLDQNFAYPTEDVGNLLNYARFGDSDSAIFQLTKCCLTPVMN
jgi:hypothetical protein